MLFQRSLFCPIECFLFFHLSKTKEVKSLDFSYRVYQVPTLRSRQAFIRPNTKTNISLRCTLTYKKNKAERKKELHSAFLLQRHEILCARFMAFLARLKLLRATITVCMSLFLILLVSLLVFFHSLVISYHNFVFWQDLEKRPFITQLPDVALFSFYFFF